MKNLILSIALVITGSITLNAQTESIEANYVLKMEFDIEAIMDNVPAAYRNEARRNLETANKEGIFMNYTLTSNGKESVYKMEEKISNDNSISGMIVQQMTAFDKEPFYKSFDSDQYTKLYDLGKRYLIKDKLPDFQWKITREKTKIAGYDATKATGIMNDTIPITAWYAPQLNFKDGPDRFWGLPGLIVKLESEIPGQAKLFYELKDVNLTNKEIKINTPTDNKTYTMKEFEAAMTELQNRMREQMNQGVDTN